MAAPMSPGKRSPKMVRVWARIISYLLLRSTPNGIEHRVDSRARRRP
jgi:hypothetical protein